VDQAELAAIVIALRQLQSSPKQEEPRISPWRLAALFPELELEEVRALSARSDV
jgi:hypothetical protein